MCVHIEVWLKSPNLTVKQAAILLANCNPSDYLDNNKLPEQYNTFVQILKNAIIGKTLTAIKMKYVFEDGIYEEVNVDENDNNFDEKITIISNSDLRTFLSEHDVIDTNFVFRCWSEEARQTDEEKFNDSIIINPEIMNEQHPHYSKVLVIAIKVWEQLADVKSDEIKGKSINQYILDWLNAHKDELGIANKTQVKEIAKLINWEKGGGAPRQ